MPVSDDGRKRIAAIMATRNEDGPEGMNPADRCLIGSRGSGGPPMLNNIYNNTYQIVQTPDHVMIDVEMMHDARIIRMNQDAQASSRRPVAGRQRRPLGWRHAGGGDEELEPLARRLRAGLPVGTGRS